MHQDDDCNLKYNLYVHREAENVPIIFRDTDFIAGLEPNSQRLSMAVFLL